LSQKLIIAFTFHFLSLIASYTSETKTERDREKDREKDRDMNRD
jgi:hypothetical protein